MKPSTARTNVPSTPARWLRHGTLAVLALSVAACTGDDGGIDFNHGSVKLEFRRGNNVDDNPFVGTTVMQVTLDYQACLIDFYTANPNWRTDGTDGETVFAPRDDGGEGWRDELCERGNVECEVISFEQQFNDNASSSLTVLYAITGDVENRTLHFGPVPLPELANCEANSLAVVRVGSNGAVRGLNGVPPEGDPLWQIQTFGPTEAVANQGASIGIDAEYSN